MTECDVIRHAGAVEKIELGANERGERSLVLTYLQGHVFQEFTASSAAAWSPSSGRRGLPAEQGKPHKPAPSAKKPAGS